MKPQFKIVRRTVTRPCPECLECKSISARCQTCGGKGEVSRSLNDYVPVTGDEDDDVLLGWAGAHS